MCHGTGAVQQDMDSRIQSPDFSLLPDTMELNGITLALLGKKLIRIGDLYITDKTM